MNPERWRRVEELFHAALERPTEERQAFLDESCSGDKDLRQQVGLLLAKEEEAGSFLETPAIEDLAVAPPPAASLLGRQFGPYQILSPIGAGGMGEVYRARDTRLDRTVAIKVLPSSLARNPERRRRFEREARAVSSLNHPHICTLHDIGQQHGIDYLVMEYLEGETLAAR